MGIFEKVQNLIFKTIVLYMRMESYEGGRFLCFFFGGGGVPGEHFFYSFFSFFVTSSVIVDVVNATGLHCVRVYAVATFMVNQGGGGVGNLFRTTYNWCELLEIRTQFTPACRFKLRVCSAFITVLIAMGIGYN